VFELDAFLTMGNQSFLMANDSEALVRARKAYHDRVERALRPGAELAEKSGEER
jgi:hypothetical protein